MGSPARRMSSRSNPSHRSGASAAPRVGNASPHSDQPSYPDIPDSAYYDSAPNYEHYEQPSPTPAFERNGKGQGKGNWKKDGGKWSKGRDNDRPRAPRTAVSVESPHLSALRTLLHHPELAQHVEDVSHFAAEDDTYAQLLVALLGALQKNPKLRSLQLIARWHGTEQGRLLRALAEKEWLISHDNLEQQFLDTITRLSAGQHTQTLDELIKKARQPGLSAEEQIQIAKQMRDLLKQNVSASNPTSTGA